MRPLSDLKRDTEVIYQLCLVKRWAKKEAADDREAATKQLPPEWQAARMERQGQAMPTKLDIAPAGLQAALYPHWMWKQNTKPRGSNLPKPYKMPKDDASGVLTLEDELDADSIFNPLVSGSQSS